MRFSNSGFFHETLGLRILMNRVHKSGFSFFGEFAEILANFDLLSAYEMQKVKKISLDSPVF